MWTREQAGASEGERTAGDLLIYAPDARSAAPIELPLAEPGLQLCLGTSDADDWTTLEVTAPSHPATVLEFDREAMTTVAGVPAIALRVLA